MRCDESITHIETIGVPARVDLARLTPEQLKVHRIRKALLILLGILLTFDLIYLIFIVHAYVDKSQLSQRLKSHSELLVTLLSVIYDAFGLIVTHKLFRTGLRVFAWIGIVSLVLLDFVGSVIHIVSWYAREPTAAADEVPIGSLVSFATSVASSIMLLTIMCLAFKLSSLLITYRAPIMRTL